MNMQQVKHQLLALADECKELGERLSSKGEELSDKDARLIRVSMLPYIQEEYEIALTKYITGGVMRPNFEFTEF